MPDRFKYAKVRQKIINALRTDLMGPQSADEILDENPKSAYIIGMLASQQSIKTPPLQVSRRLILILRMETQTTIPLARMMIMSDHDNQF